MRKTNILNTQLKIGKYSIEIPIIQGGMGVGVSWDQLAGTVSNEGALGVISTVGTGYFDYPKYLGGENLKVPSKENCNSKDALFEIFRRARLICENKPLAVNIMHVLSGYKQNVIDSCEAGADIIICGAGLAVDLPNLTKNYPDVALIPIVSSPRALKILAKKWARFGKIPDAIIVEGPLSGGHQGVKKEDCFLPENQLEVVVPKVIEESKKYGSIPIIAAGGIWDNSDINKFLDMGCSGVQMGTRFVATQECDTSDMHKAILVACKEDHISLKGSPAKFPSRSISTNLHRLIEYNKAPKIVCKSDCVSPCERGKEARNVGYCIADRLGDALLGKEETGLFFTGSNGYRVNKIISVKELLNELVNGE